MLSVRPFERADAPAVLALDTSFTTTSIYTVAHDDRGFSLTLARLDAPLTKRFPLDDLEAPHRPWSDAWVAVVDGSIAGFAATFFERWNARLVLWHLYVDPRLRRQGIARRILDEIEMHARNLCARHIWLETSSLNAPGASVYRALGFDLSGLDLTLYDATPADGEVALFFSKPVGSR